MRRMAKAVLIEVEPNEIAAEAKDGEALEELHDEFRKRKVRLVLCEIRQTVAEKLTRAGFLQRVGAEKIFNSRDEFLASIAPPSTHSPPP